MLQGHAHLRRAIAPMCVVLLFTLLLASRIATATHNGSVAVLPNHLDGYDLLPYLSYWYDPAPQSSLEMARTQLLEGHFRPLDHQSANLGFAKGSHWFHLILQNNLSNERNILAEIDYPVLDNLEFFCFGPSQPPAYYPAGDHLQFDSRLVKVRNYVIPLKLEPQVQTECLIRVHSETNVIFPLQAYDVFPLIEKNQRVDLALGVFYGLALALLMYNFVIYVATREVMHLYFMLHVLGGIMYTSLADGTLANCWISLELQDIGLLLSVILGVGACVQFGLTYLKIATAWPAAYKVGVGLNVLLVGSLGLMLWDGLMLGHIATTIITLCVAIFLLLLGVKRWRDGYQPALAYVICYGAMMLIICWICLNVLVLKADVRWITYGVSSAWLCEMLFLSLGLGVKFQQDNRERSELSQQMQAAIEESHTKTEFMAKVSHEVRTPMNGILGLAELLLGTPLNEDQRRYLNAIRHAGKGLQDVISDVLDYSRLEAGKVTLVKASFDLEGLLQDACSIYEFEARNKRIELGCFIAGGTPLQLIGDGNRIRQVLLNLLSNAFKHTHQGYVHVNVQLTDQILPDQLMLQFEVEDSGVGISMQDQHKLFQNFFQVHQGQTAAATGSGLGLVISQQLVELMGGEMGLKSEFGRGSSFWFNLPLALPDDVRVAEHAIALDLFDGIPTDLQEHSVSTLMPGLHGSKENRVLVVEDNEINQSVILGFLEKLNITAELAENGRTAVELLQQRKQYDLILMDCEMPVMDGYEAASRILKWQQASGLPQTPIIALSAHALDKHREMARDVGMLDYLAKPITFKQLVDKIGRYIDLPVDAAMMG